MLKGLPTVMLVKFRLVNSRQLATDELKATEVKLEARILLKLYSTAESLASNFTRPFLKNDSGKSNEMEMLGDCEVEDDIFILGEVNGRGETCPCKYCTTLLSPATS